MYRISAYAWHKWYIQRVLYSRQIFAKKHICFFVPSCHAVTLDHANFASREPKESAVVQNHHPPREHLPLPGMSNQASVHTSMLGSTLEVSKTWHSPVNWHALHAGTPRIQLLVCPECRQRTVPPDSAGSSILTIQRNSGKHWITFK